MEPTIAADDYLLVDEQSFRHASPHEGDIVIYGSSGDPPREAIHRVVGVEGERVEIRDKALFIDGHAQAEPYAVYRDPRVYRVGSEAAAGLLPGRDHIAPYIVPAGWLFVLGDNRDNAFDSRFAGAVPRVAVEGGGRLRIYWSRNPQTGAVRSDRIAKFSIPKTLSVVRSSARKSSRSTAPCCIDSPPEKCSSSGTTNRRDRCFRSRPDRSFLPNLDSSVAKQMARLATFSEFMKKFWRVQPNPFGIEAFAKQDDIFLARDGRNFASFFSYLNGERPEARTEDSNAD